VTKSKETLLNASRDIPPEESRPAIRPTMRDVAALARVSLPTVSRVLNGEPTVAAELAERVRRAATALDYRPDLTARNLRSSAGRTRTIGLIVENVANPFSSAFYRAVEDGARKRGVAVFACSGDESPERERRLARELVARGVDGLIIVPASDDQSYLANDQRAGVHVVFADRPPRLLTADAVLSDNLGGAREGVLQLAAAGHRRIAFLGNPMRIRTAADRFAGYAEALNSYDIELDKKFVMTELSGPGVIQEAERAVHALIRDAGPTAIFASQNLITIGAIRALRELRLEQRIALVGFDDLLLADLLEPALTMVAQSPAAMGAEACALLFQRMAGDLSPPKVRMIPTRLICRGSGEIAPDPTIDPEA
jgi:LacI family transcriptional regulator